MPDSAYGENSPSLHLAIDKMLKFLNNVMLKFSSRYFLRGHQVLKLVVGWRGKLYGWVESFLPHNEYHRLRLRIELERGEIVK